MTPSTPPPKFLRKSPFSGHFITLVEELPSLFFADGNMTLHYKTPRQYPESSKTIPRPFQTPSRHLQDTPQTPKIWALFVHTIPVGVKQAANKNESNGMYINCLHIIPSNHNPESLRQPPDTSHTPSRHLTDTPNLDKFWLFQGHWEQKEAAIKNESNGMFKKCLHIIPFARYHLKSTPRHLP